MFAVIETGGKQYKVAKDQIIKVEKLAGEAGDKIVLDRVLLIDDGKSVRLGAPLVTGVNVSAEIVEQTRGDKIIVFKKNRRKNYRRKRGHRQLLTALRILEIGAAKKSTPKKAVKPKADAPDDKPKAKAVAKPKAEAKGPKAATKALAKKATTKKAPAKKPAAKAKKET